MDSRKSRKESDLSAGRILFWSFVIGVNAYDFLGLCHLVPTHTLHLFRPYMMTTAQFKIGPRSGHKTRPTREADSTQSSAVDRHV